MLRRPSLAPKTLLQAVDLEKAHALLLSAPPAALAAASARPKTWIRPMQAQVIDEGDDRERRRLVGAVGADELQVRPEGRPVEQARHRELADHDGEGEEARR